MTVHHFSNFGKLSNNLIIRELTNRYIYGSTPLREHLQRSSKCCGAAKLFANLSENRQLDMAKHKLVVQF